MSDSPINLNPVLVLTALANVNRLQIIGLMAQGEKLTLNGLVKATKRSYKAVHKDMDALWAAGAVTMTRGEDKRVGFFYVPEPYLPQPGVVDYGICAVRFGAAAKLPEKIPMLKD